MYGVRDTALEFGKRFNLDLEKLELASLLHDMTKYFTHEKHVDMIEQNFENSDEILSKFNKEILHAFSARIYAQKEYGIEDTDATFLKSLQSLGEFVSNPNYVDGGTAVDATVCVWYDQSSTDGVANANDASQNVATSQPLIVSGGVIVTENGKPAIEGDGTNGKHLTTSNTTLSGDLAVITVCSFDTFNLDSMLFGGTFAATKGYLWMQGLTQMNWKNDSENGFANFTVSLLTANNLIFGNRAGTDVSMAVNGSNNTVTENATQGLSFTINRIGGALQDSYSLDGTYQEMIFYNSDQSSNRTDIEEDINSFYQIDGYTPTPKLIDLTQDLAVQNGGTIADGTAKS